MNIIRVTIVRWVNNENPGWVECILTDASGCQWRFIDKLPTFSSNPYLDENSEYPQPGILACEIIEEKTDRQGRNIFVVNTEKPWGVEAVGGTTCFDVLQEQVEST